MHYYQHHIGDFIKDTSNLNDHQLATYMRMLWAYYDNEKPFIDDLEDIAFAMRSDEKTVRLLLKHYFVSTEFGWSHKRCDQEIAQYHSKSDKAKKGANARWSNADAMRTHTERNTNASDIDANQEPITNNHKPIIKNKAKSQPDKPSDVSDSVWQDFLQIRKAKRSPMTDTALQQIRAEADKANITLQTALEHSCARGWQGFKAEWLIESTTQRASATNGETAYQRSIRERVAEIAPGVARKAPRQFNPNFIDEVSDVIAIESH